MKALDSTVRERLLALLPPKLHAMAFVAGGYSADPEQAADIDIWLLTGHLRDFGAEAALDIHLRDVHKVSTWDRIGWRDRLAADVAAYEGDEFFVITTLPASFTGLGKPVQVFSTVHQFPSSLLAAFDINVHQCGEMLVDGTMAFGPDFVPLVNQPVLRSNETREVKAERALARLDKLADRYGLAIDFEDRQRLLTLEAAFASVHAERETCDFSSMSDAA
jgi:hypothetical protein